MVSQDTKKAKVTELVGGERAAKWTQHDACQVLAVTVSCKFNPKLERRGSAQDVSLRNLISWVSATVSTSQP